MKTAHVRISCVNGRLTMPVVMMMAKLGIRRGPFVVRRNGNRPFGSVSPPDRGRRCAPTISAELKKFDPKMRH
jgi:hypothetical protein